MSRLASLGRGRYYHTDDPANVPRIFTAETLAITRDLVVEGNIQPQPVETGEPITTEGLRYGFRVAVVGIPCADAWRTEPGLALVGPRYFGYDVPFVPVEERFGAARASSAAQTSR